MVLPPHNIKHVAWPIVKAQDPSETEARMDECRVTPGSSIIC